MTRYRVEFRREALDDVEELYDHIAEARSAADAASFVDAIVAHCEGLDTFPNRGSLRDDIRPGLRTIAYRKRTVIAYVVRGQVVTILGIYYGGRDIGRHIPEDRPPDT